VLLCPFFFFSLSAFFSTPRYYFLFKKKKKKKKEWQLTLSVLAMCQRAKLHARIKPTALCSVFDKENSIDFLLDSVYYLYMKSNPNPSFYPVLPYESLSSPASINKKNKIK